MFSFNQYIMLILFLIFVRAVSGFIHLPQHITPGTPCAVQTQAVQDLVARLVGNRTAKRFVLKVDKTLEFRSYQISKVEQRVHINGWDGIAVAKGFHYYLKYALQQDVDWSSTRQIVIDANVTLPKLNVHSRSASPIIYYQNVCTWSYSFAWWSWSTWRQHIDWMALMGISLTIAPIQEQIWYDVYTAIGLTVQEIAVHFAGPAFQAWQRMGNIRGWAGPLPDTYRRMQLLLQQQILQAQRALGMSVALPAFAGHVPVAFKRLYPNISFARVQRWNDFPDSYCCGLFLEPSEPLFTVLGSKFLQQIVKIYGTNHIYFSDPFNEIDPRLAERNYVSMIAQRIYESMQQVDGEAIWLLQGWMFLKATYWSNELIEAFLTAVPLGKILVLDLQSEQFPQYQRTHSFYGQPFIWCMLHNFGGTLGMFGSTQVINQQIRSARHIPHSTMLGVGITPEGIHQNYALYALTLERGWVDADFDLDAWFAYFAVVRYSVHDERLSQAWQLLQRSVYSFNSLRKMRGKYTITRRPAFNLEPWIWYNDSSVTEAWHLMLIANDSITTANAAANYAHDLVDLTRQYLQNMADRLYVNLKSAYRKRQLERYNYLAKKLLELFDDLEMILATHKQFLLGPWLANARDMAVSAQQAEIYEFNARNQITIWGPTGQILDYANKQWSGLVTDYYQARWSLFLNETQQCLNTGETFNYTTFKILVAKNVEQPFSLAKKLYPVNGSGNSVETSKRIYDKWLLNYQQEQQFLHYNRLQVKLVA